MVVNSIETNLYFIKDRTFHRKGANMIFVFCLEYSTANRLEVGRGKNEHQKKDKVSRMLLISCHFLINGMINTSLTR